MGPDPKSSCFPLILGEEGGEYLQAPRRRFPGWIFGCQREIWEWVRKDTASTEMCARGASMEPPPNLWVLQVPQKQPGRAADPHPVPVGLIPSVQLCRVDSQLPAPRRAALRHQPRPEQAGEERNESKGN